MRQGSLKRNKNNGFLGTSQSYHWGVGQYGFCVNKKKKKKMTSLLFF